MAKIRVIGRDDFGESLSELLDNSVRYFLAEQVIGCGIITRGTYYDGVVKRTNPFIYRVKIRLSSFYINL